MTGGREAIEAGWLIPGGTAFLFELGVRGAERELSLFGGVRIDLTDAQGVLDLTPFVRGGLSAGRVLRDGDRIALGPYLAVGVRRELFYGVALALSATLHSSVAPFALALGGAVTLSAQTF